MATSRPITATSSRPSQPPPRRTARRLVRSALLTALTAGVALAVAYGLERAHAGTHPVVATLTLLQTERPGLLLLGGLLVWAVLGLLFALSGRLWIALGGTLALATVLAVADVWKMRLRLEPVFPADVEYLTHPRLLVDAAGARGVLALAALVVALLAAAYGLARLARRGRLPAARPRRGRLAAQAVCGVLSGALLVGAGLFNRPGAPLRPVYERAGAEWASWDQVDNYATNGFLAGLLYNMPGPVMPRPPGYDESTMRQIAAEYREAALTINATRDPAALADTNIVIVLGETVSDPLRMLGVHLEEDPLPFTRRLMSATTSGTILTPAFGGGTANVEFEVLTGMALRNFEPQMRTPFQTLIPHEDTFPSFVTSLAEGRDTLAIHPFVASFYRRDVVYPALGFDRRVFEGDMVHRDHVERNPYVSDAATYKEVVDELRASDRPLLMNVVTMQNHLPFWGLYDDPIDVTGPFDPAEAGDLGQYLRGLRYSDDALAQLVGDLDRLDERTIVLFYGDHLPGAWPPAALAMNPPVVQHETPYLVYANFPTAPLPATPPLSPTFLVNRMLDTANAPLTPYNALLERLAQQVPAYEVLAVLNDRGEQVTEADLSPQARHLLDQYRLVQYDLAVGKRYSAAEMLTVPDAGS
ncbi:LTA synthase family protein [Georgenia thermotolerans]|uniref:Sulfatase-like hydrolase/transferase n=1 Tax=Georgenia thermotolerans TaxID=527326 RepID=A0A7J5UQ99_9MICO|nr:LTA synthase family protein [Georgenia thermotolerans]KAE8764390.1 sulfatase-like hydrolase/transferase [Georgenia thermotolerans]